MSPSMVQTVGGGLLVSPSLAQPRDCALRGAASSCRNSRTARNDSDQLGLDPVVIHVSQPLLESLACCGRPRPRVAIAGPNRSGCDRHPPRVVIRRRPPTCTFRWADNIPYRPACYGRRPPRVAIAGSNRFGSRLVVGVVGGGVHSFFLRVGRYRYHTQHSASLHTPPVYIDYIIILSYRLRRVSVLRPAPSSCRNSKTARNLCMQVGG